jgi:hypothetical protein
LAGPDRGRPAEPCGDGGGGQDGGHQDKGRPKAKGRHGSCAEGDEGNIAVCHRKCKTRVVVMCYFFSAVSALILDISITKKNINVPSKAITDEST